MAKALQLGIEYYPAPPFPERGPNDVPKELLERVRKADGGTETLRVRPPFDGLLALAGGSV